MARKTKGQRRMDQIAIMAGQSTCTIDHARPEGATHYRPLSGMYYREGESERAEYFSWVDRDWITSSYSNRALANMNKL